MQDHDIIGKTLPTHTASADTTRLRFFAKAIGETNPVYTEAEAARLAGFDSLPLPPTFLFCLDTDARDDAVWLEEIGISYPHVLHAEQSFTYHRMVCAGESVEFASTVTERYDRRNGELRFVALDTRITDLNGDLVAEMRTKVVEKRQR